MIRNLEQWVYYGIKFGGYKNDWSLLKLRKSSKILTHRAVLAVPTFWIPVPKSLAAIAECSEIHERIWVFPEAFLIVNLPDECLKNYIMIQEIWQHHREFREEKELRKVGAKNHCNQYIYFAFREKQRKKVWTTAIVLSLWLTIPRVSGLYYSKWHHNSELSFLGDASGKIPRPYGISGLDCKLPNRGLLEGGESTRALQWIKEIEAAKSLDDLNTPKSITGKDFHDYEELDLTMASALKRCYDKQTHFRKKISVEEEWAQKHNRFLRGRQIAYLIYEYFRPTGSHDEIQGSSGCSVSNWTTTTFRILIYVGSKHCYWQVILHRTKF